MTSWRVRSSCSRMRAGSSLPAAFARTAAVVPAGTVPAFSIAAQAASSTRSQVSYRWPSDQSSTSSLRV